MATSNTEADPNAEEIPWVTTVEMVGATRAKELYDLRIPWETKALTTLGVKNRKPDFAVVQDYANAMLRGEWELISDGIKITAPDDDGQIYMIDGQQRLLGIMEAAKTNPDIRVPLAIYSGIDPSVFKVLDTGRKRTTTQALAMLEVPNYPIVASVIRYVELWYKNVPQNKWKNYPALSNAEIIRLYQNVYPDIAHESHRIGYAGHNVGVSRVSTVVFHYILRHTYPETFTARPKLGKDGADGLSMLDEFLLDLKTGASLPAGDPVLALRNFSIGANRQVGSTPRSNPAQVMGITKPMFWLMLLMRTWNARVTGSKIVRPAWQKGQEIPKPLRPRAWENYRAANADPDAKDRMAEYIPNPDLKTGELAELLAFGEDE